MTSILALWSAFLVAAPAGPVTGISIAPDAARTQVVINVTGEVTVSDFTMDGPSRLVVDLRGAKNALPSQSYIGIYRGGVSSVLVSEFDADVVRVTFTLAQMVPYQVETRGGSVRITLENREGAFEPWSTANAFVPSAAPNRPSTTASAPAPRAAAPAVQVPQEKPRITQIFRDMPLLDALDAFADISQGYTIIAGQSAQRAVPAVSGSINDQPWDLALQSLLRTNGLVGEETRPGIIEVRLATDISARETESPLETRNYPIRYASAAEIQTAIQGVKSARGSSALVPGANAIVVTEIPRVHDAINELLPQLDIQPQQVSIEAKIVFVSNTELDEKGITYDLKDSSGNQLNVLTPGLADLNGNGTLELPDEQVEVGTNVVSLGGNSIAALGNATTRVAGPNLTLLTSLLIGRHTLIGFIDALQSSNLTRVEARPNVTVMDHQTASITVGERTPIRTIDAGASGGATGGGATLPVATVSIEQTGIILTATPHITGPDEMRVNLSVERSAPQLAATDAGVAFTNQKVVSNVLLRDGQTYMISGLTVTETSEIRSGIPLLMNLPLIGKLFRVTREAEATRDLIILVTPHMIGAGGN
jgi:type IV pilus assembly protein PilQ